VRLKKSREPHVGSASLEGNRAAIARERIP
jgi:hypothetical protein